MTDMIADNWDIAYLHAPGRINGVFLEALSQANLLIRDCPTCGRRSIPPCSCWDAPGNRWRTASGQASLIAAVPIDETDEFQLGLIRVDGCDTALVQRVRGLDSGLASDARLQVVFAASPRGDMQDFWFEPGGGRSR